MRKQKTGILRIIRPNAYFALLRGLVIRINGEKVGSVNNDDSFEIELPSGDYAITVHMDWCRSQSFDFHLDVDQIITLRAELNGGTLGAMLNSFFRPHKLYTLIPITDKSKRKNDDFA